MNLKSTKRSWLLRTTERHLTITQMKVKQPAQYGEVEQHNRQPECVQNSWISQIISYN
jgi:hypothetical protein